VINEYKKDKNLEINHLICEYEKYNKKF